MADTPRPTDPAAPHISVLIDPLIAAVSPVEGLWLDGTFGAGGYTRRLLEAGAETVIGVDRDPTALELAAPLKAEYGDRSPPRRRPLLRA